MTVVQLPEELESRLERAATETRRSKSYYIRKTLKEDREDYLLATARLEENNPRISLDEALKEIGLYDQD